MIDNHSEEPQSSYEIDDDYKDQKKFLRLRSAEIGQTMKIYKQCD